MSFRLVPKSLTLNDIERHNGPYFALFHRIRVRCRRKKFTFAVSSPDEFVVFLGQPNGLLRSERATAVSYENLVNLVEQTIIRLR